MLEVAFWDAAMAAATTREGARGVKVLEEVKK